MSADTLVTFRVVCDRCGKVMREGSLDAPISLRVCAECTEHIRKTGPRSYRNALVVSGAQLGLRKATEEKR